MLTKHVQPEDHLYAIPNDQSQNTLQQFWLKQERERERGRSKDLQVILLMAGGLKRVRAFLGLPDNATPKLHRSLSRSIRWDVDFELDQPEKCRTSGAPNEMEAIDLDAKDMEAKDMEDKCMEQCSLPEEPCTPTMVESMDSTQKDSDSQWSPANDDLLNLLGESSPSPSPTGSTFYPCETDSEATEKNDEENDKQQCHQGTTPKTEDTGSPVHWSLNPRFQEDVENTLRYCRQQLWFDDKLSMLSLDSWDESVQLATNFIATNFNSWWKFKIGITENPFVRWNNSGFGYKHEKEIMWDYFAVIYCAPTSKVTAAKFASEGKKELIRTSTGSMDNLLIGRFADLPNCINRVGGGGDCPSYGSPHFCYVVASWSIE